MPTKLYLNNDILSMLLKLFYSDLTLIFIHISMTYMLAQKINTNGTF